MESPGPAARNTGSEETAHINWTPAGKPSWHGGWINGCARGIEQILMYMDRDGGDHPPSYDLIMVAELGSKG